MFQHLTKCCQSVREPLGTARCFSLAQHSKPSKTWQNLTKHSETWQNLSKPEKMNEVKKVPILITSTGGSGTTFLANIFTNSGQPALFYLSPILILSSLGTAFFNESVLGYEEEFSKVIQFQNSKHQKRIKQFLHSSLYIELTRQ